MQIGDILSIIVLGLSLYFGLIDSGIWQAVAGSVKTSRPSLTKPPRSRRVQAAAPVQAGSAQQNGQNAGSAVQPANATAVDAGAHAGSLNISAKELTDLTKSVMLFARGATKKAAIEQGFSCTKGGGKVWARACELWAAAGVEEGA